MLAPAVYYLHLHPLIIDGTQQTDSAAPVIGRMSIDETALL